MHIASTDESTGSKLNVYDISLEDGDEQKEDKAVEPKKTEMQVEFASLESGQWHRIMPLDSQGRCAILYQDKKMQYRLEQFDTDTERQSKGQEESQRATDMGVIPDSYFDDHPFIAQPITQNLVALHDIPQNTTRLVQLKNARILKLVRHKYSYW